MKKSTLFDAAFEEHKEEEEEVGGIAHIVPSELLKELTKHIKNAVFKYHPFGLTPNDREELNQAVMAKIANNFTWDPNRGKLSTWVFRVVFNYLTDIHRKKQTQGRTELVSFQDIGSAGDDESSTERHQSSLGAEIAQILVADADDASEIDKKLVYDTLMKAVAQLGPKYEPLLYKRYFEQLSYEEIAEVLNLPLGTVKVQMFRAKQLLLELLSQSTVLNEMGYHNHSGTTSRLRYGQGHNSKFIDKARAKKHKENKNFEKFARSYQSEVYKKEGDASGKVVPRDFVYVPAKSLVLQKKKIVLSAYKPVFATASPEIVSSLLTSCLFEIFEEEGIEVHRVGLVLEDVSSAVIAKELVRKIQREAA